MRIHVVWYCACLCYFAHASEKHVDFYIGLAPSPKSVISPRNGRRSPGPALGFCNRTDSPRASPELHPSKKHQVRSGSQSTPSPPLVDETTSDMRSAADSDEWVEMNHEPSGNLPSTTHVEKTPAGEPDKDPKIQVVLHPQLNNLQSTERFFINAHKTPREKAIAKSDLEFQLATDQLMLTWAGLSPERESVPFSDRPATESLDNDNDREDLKTVLSEFLSPKDPRKLDDDQLRQILMVLNGGRYPLHAVDLEPCTCQNVVTICYHFQ